MAKNVKLDNTITTTRPDLNINFAPIGKPGSFVVKNGLAVPNLKDEATEKRETKRLKEEQPKPSEQKLEG